MQRSVWAVCATCVALVVVGALAGGCGDIPSAEVAPGLVPESGAVAPGVEGGSPPADSGSADGARLTSFSIGVIVTGLATGGGTSAVVLENNGGDALEVKANGAFVFPTKLADGASFNVEVKTQPVSPPQTCTVSAGSGFVVASNVTSVTVHCAIDTHTVGGTITGLAGAVTLSNNGVDNIVTSAAGKFTFPTALASGAAYDVQVTTQPSVPTQVCVVTAGTGTGTVGLADVTSVDIVCTTSKLAIGGTVAGLGGGTVVLQNNGGDDLSVSADAPFTFPTTIASGAPYAVTVLTDPAGRSCFVSNASGTVAGAAVTTVKVACTPNQPNCTGLAQTCGAAGAGSCCESAVVPAGTFSRSYDGVNAGFSDPKFAATVSDFRLDTYEVTVGRFRSFMAGYPGNKPADGAGKNPNNAADPGWDATWNATKLPATRAALVTSLKTCGLGGTWTDVNGTAFEESRAMNCIAWHEAFAFCIWDGGRLPTEAEWNYAAAGGSEQRVYPWSTPATSTTIGASYATYNNAPAWDIVGSKPAGNGRWGHSDLAGNVWEWTVDWARTPYSSTTCNDCADFVASNMHVVRGGGINNAASLLFTSFRGTAPLPAANPRVFDIGVRCARTP